jgi:hypothetical protein
VAFGSGGGCIAVASSSTSDGVNGLWRGALEGGEDGGLGGTGGGEVTSPLPDPTSPLPMPRTNPLPQPLPMLSGFRGHGEVVGVERGVQLGGRGGMGEEREGGLVEGSSLASTLARKEFEVYPCDTLKHKPESLNPKS